MVLDNCIIIRLLELRIPSWRRLLHSEKPKGRTRTRPFPLSKGSINKTNCDLNCLVLPRYYCYIFINQLLFLFLSIQSLLIINHVSLVSFSGNQIISLPFHPFCVLCANGSLNLPSKFHLFFYFFLTWLFG